MVIQVTQKHINDALAYKGTLITRNCPIARAFKDRGFDPEVSDSYVLPFCYLNGCTAMQREKEYELPEEVKEFINVFDSDDREPSDLKPFKFTIKNLKPIDVTTGPPKTKPGIAEPSNKKKPGAKPGSKQKKVTAA